MKEETSLPVEADVISPDRFAGLSHEQITALPILLGRRRVPLGDLFEVEGDGTSEIVIVGDLSHVKRVGQGMSQGHIAIHGSVGMHLGNTMRGGELVVEGDVGAWAGAQMMGGMLRVHGDAGAMLGGVYAGETRGMRGGVITVQGDAGPRAGERMRRGLIVVQGNTGEFAGARMIAGTIIILGSLGSRAGAGMKRGTIVALSGLATSLLPTFHYGCVYQPVFLRYYLRRLQTMGVPVTEQQIDGAYHRYTGDVNTIGKGEILVYV
jgi:formylmethanofuran dehydrogenase subunit C